MKRLNMIEWLDSPRGQYVVYRYVCDNEVMYIGRTKNLENRLKVHRSDLFFIEEPEVEYCLCNDYRESVDKELFYIHKLNPTLNHKRLPYKKEFEDNWIKLKTPFRHKLVADRKFWERMLIREVCK